MKWNGTRKGNNRHVNLGGTSLQLQVTDTGGNINTGGMMWRLHRSGSSIIRGDCNDFADGELQATRWLLRFWLAIGRQLEE